MYNLCILLGISEGIPDPDPGFRVPGPPGDPPRAGDPPGPRKSRIFPRNPGFRPPRGTPPGPPKTGFLGPRGQIWAPGWGYPWGRAGRMPRDPGFPGSGVCSPCRGFWGFSGCRGPFNKCIFRSGFGVFSGARRGARGRAREWRFRGFPGGRGTPGFGGLLGVCRS